MIDTRNKVKMVKVNNGHGENITNMQTEVCKSWYNTDENIDTEKKIYLHKKEKNKTTWTSNFFYLDK